MPCRNLRKILSLVALVAISPASAESPSRYKLEFLPLPPGCQAASQIHGLDNRGRVLGVMSCDEFATQRAVVWDNSALIEPECVLTEVQAYPAKPHKYGCPRKSSYACGHAPERDSSARRDAFTGLRYHRYRPARQRYRASNSRAGPAQPVDRSHEPDN